jgi:hypothetical protein
MFASDEEYYRDREYLSNSSMGILMSSLDKFYLWRNDLLREEDSSAFALGKATHSKFLEQKDIAVGYDERRGTNAYKLFEEQNRDKIILSKSEYSTYRGMINALEDCQEVQSLMDRSLIKVEVPAISEIYDVPVKGKADALLDDGFSKILIDLKTTGGTVMEFQDKARYYDYDRQAALYKHLFKADQFIFVVVSKKYPYEIGIFDCSDSFLDSGNSKIYAATMRYKKHFIDQQYKYGTAYRSEL